MRPVTSAVVSITLSKVLPTPLGATVSATQPRNICLPYNHGIIGIMRGSRQTNACGACSAGGGGGMSGASGGDFIPGIAETSTPLNISALVKAGVFAPYVSPS